MPLITIIVVLSLHTLTNHQQNRAGTGKVLPPLLCKDETANGAGQHAEDESFCAIDVNAGVDNQIEFYSSRGRIRKLLLARN